MSQINESDTVYEGQYFKAFINEKQMLEIQTISNDNFICMVTLIDSGSFAEHYIDKMKDELDEIKEMFVDSSSKYSHTLFGTDFMESLDKLTIRK